MSLSESMEDYLEAIFEIQNRKQVVRVRDVAQELGVTMPSVNGALKILEANGFISHEKYEYIALTETGVIQASKISRTHVTIRQFLETVLGVDHQTAEQEACRIEHDLSPATIEKLTGFLDRYIKL
jgi:DtxR family transcriptional regulator, Mn-dependent transcriptional regulator